VCAVHDGLSRDRIQLDSQLAVSWPTVATRMCPAALCARSKAGRSKPRGARRQCSRHITRQGRSEGTTYHHGRSGPPPPAQGNGFTTLLQRHRRVAPWANSHHRQRGAGGPRATRTPACHSEALRGSGPPAPWWAGRNPCPSPPDRDERAPGFRLLCAGVWGWPQQAWLTIPLRGGGGQRRSAFSASWRLAAEGHALAQQRPPSRRRLQRG